MKIWTKSLKSIMTAVLIIMMASAGTGLYAQKQSGKIKIGTYDSRIITFAFSRSAYFSQYLGKINVQNDSAVKANDSARITELGIQMLSYQHLLHLRVFGNGSVISIMDLVKDQLPEVAKSAGVSIILNKWELNYNDPSIEIIDVTDQIVQLFKPKEDIAKMEQEIRNIAPIPVEDLTVEKDMLDLYCTKFHNK